MNDAEFGMLETQIRKADSVEDLKSVLLEVLDWLRYLERRTDQ